jgi:hypothetical protein
MWHRGTAMPFIMNMVRYAGFFKVNTCKYIRIWRKSAYLTAFQAAQAQELTDTA